LDHQNSFCPFFAVPAGQETPRREGRKPGGTGLRFKV
jgi:hypothetical protein